MTGSFSSSHVVHSRLFHSVTFAILASGMMALPCVGQQSAALDALPQAPSTLAAIPAPDAPPVTLPIGTPIPLVLTRPVNSNLVHSGDQIFAQVSTPVMAGDQVAIPAGTFVRGEVEKLTRNGTRGELLMRSASLVMGSGGVNLGGPVKIESQEWTAYSNPAGRTKAGIILAPILGTGLGLAIGAATDKSHTVTVGSGPTALTTTENSHRGLVIGGGVGGAAGMVTSLMLGAHNKQFYLEEGTPLDMTLSRAVSLTQAQVAEAEHNTAPVQVIRRTRAWPGPGNNPPVGFPSGPSSGPGSCTAGQDWCQGQCKDTSAFLNDDNNCGRCGNSCGIGESCTGGTCMKQP